MMSVRSEILVSCNDQVLKITEAPVLASGGLNEVRVVFNFCEKWNGFIKTAIFYRDTDAVYYAVLDENNTCIVPWEVCYEEGTFFFSVFGDMGEIRRTASIVRYKVKNGAITSDMQPSEPTPEVYDQIMAMLVEVKDSQTEFISEAEKVVADAEAAAEDARAAAEEAREAAADVPVEVNSWEMVQQLVRLGVANKVFSIGDQLVCNHKTYGTLVWDIIGIDHDTPVNTAYKHSLTIQLHDCIDLTTFQFDAPEPTNPNKDRQTYGSNNWLESGIRQWLNSDGDAGNWWEAKTEYDVKPSFADSYPGFLKGLDADFLSVIGKVSKITALNPVTDGGGSVTSAEKFFLLSKTEVYAGPLKYTEEGVAYPYYSDNSVMSDVGITEDANRIKYRNGAAQFWWLRTPSYASSKYVWGVDKEGDALTTNAYNSRGVAPACCIV